MDALASGLARADLKLRDFWPTIRANEHRVTHVRALPDPALALALSEVTGAEHVVVIFPESERAHRFYRQVKGLRQDALFFTAFDTSPFLELAKDRRATMDRLRCLARASAPDTWRVLCTSVPALLRKLPPPAALRRFSFAIEETDIAPREELVERLDQAGYLRVPLVEDPGSFAVRGDIVDIYSPLHEHPVRVELDEELVAALRYFDADSQRTQQACQKLEIPPVREHLLTPKGESELRKRARALCDEVNMPTVQARALVDDLAEGRSFYGIDAWLPCFYNSLTSFRQHLPERLHMIVVDPSACEAQAQHDWDSAAQDREERLSTGHPTFATEAHLLSPDELAAQLIATDGATASVHRIAQLGTGDDSPFSALEPSDEEQLQSLGAEDQLALAQTLQHRRASGHEEDLLGPLFTHVGAWLEDGFRVVIGADSQSQAERLRQLFSSRGHRLSEALSLEAFASSWTEFAPGSLQLVVGAWAGGFVVASEALAVVTSDEIFGGRTRRRQTRARRRKETSHFLEDLQTLAVGDYVVHMDHGIGRYLGLEKKTLGISQYEQMQGVKATVIEVAAIEYAGGDKLFVPVTRMGQMQRYASKDGHKPRLDKLGGQSFKKTKARVRKEVKRLADDLLKVFAERAAFEREPVASADASFTSFEASFPFEETVDQVKAIDDVLSDLERDQPMDRVVCGDVGFGKTEVAMRAAFRVAMDGRQVAVLCPTTVLAQQHFRSFRERFAAYPIEVRSLSRFVSKDGQRETLTGLKKGSVDVVIGTHRLLSKDVHFKNLGLLVVDEEQRFGVTHKERIKSLRAKVDVLTLSATPIPRTLQMSVAGLRDLSLITTAPVDRRAVRTFVARWDEQVIRDAVRRELSRGGQVFFVYNRIEGLYERAQKLQDLIPEAKVAVAHGQMRERELERIMVDFVEGRYDVLCATAIIESGLDIPRANTMIIDRADIFGLAQLYQLRGRVGRSKERAYCYLLTPPPNQMSEEARSRIEALERFTELGSGFKVASLDMELRGAGDLLGAEQSGNISAVGIDVFMRMLEEAIAELRGDAYLPDVDTELSFQTELYIPEEYISDVGVRLSVYKRLDRALTPSDALDVAEELEDRFGPPPLEVQKLVRAMSQKPRLRALRVLGAEATKTRVTLHLQQDTPLDPAKVMALVAEHGSGYSLSPDMKLSRRMPGGFGDDDIQALSDTLDQVEELRREPEQAM